MSLFLLRFLFRCGHVAVPTGAPVIVVSAQLEAELVELSKDERIEMLNSLGVEYAWSPELGCTMPIIVKYDGEGGGYALLTFYGHQACVRVCVCVQNGSKWLDMMNNGRHAPGMADIGPEWPKTAENSLNGLKSRKMATKTTKKGDPRTCLVGKHMTLSMPPLLTFEVTTHLRVMLPTTCPPSSLSSEENCGLKALVREAYSALGLQTYFTTGVNDIFSCVSHNCVGNSFTSHHLGAFLSRAHAPHPQVQENFGSYFLRSFFVVF